MGSQLRLPAAGHAHALPAAGSAAQPHAARRGRQRRRAVPAQPRTSEGVWLEHQRHAHPGRPGEGRERSGRAPRRQPHQAQDAADRAAVERRRGDRGRRDRHGPQRPDRVRQPGVRGGHRLRPHRGSRAQSEPPQVRRALQRLLRGSVENLYASQVFRGTFINRKKSGELFLTEQTITPIRKPGGGITHVVSVGKDVTELRRAAERRAHLLLARSVQQRLFPSSPPQGARARHLRGDLRGRRHGRGLLRLHRAFRRAARHRHRRRERARLRLGAADGRDPRGAARDGPDDIRAQRDPRGRQPRAPRGHGGASVRDVDGGEPARAYAHPRVLQRGLASALRYPASACARRSSTPLKAACRGTWRRPRCARVPPPTCRRRGTC